MHTLALRFSKARQRGYMAAGPEHLTTSQKPPSVSASVRNSFRFPTNTMPSPVKDSRLRSLPVGSELQRLPVRGRVHPAWRRESDGRRACRPRGGRKDTPGGAGGSAAPFPAGAGTLPSRPRGVRPQWVGDAPSRSHLATQTTRERGAAPPRPTPERRPQPRAHERHVSGDRRPTLWSANGPSDPRDLRQPIEARATTIETAAAA